MNNSPIACTLSPDELHCCADELLPGLARSALAIAHVADGVRLEFDAATGVIPRIANVIDRERLCCRFLNFALDIPGNGATITLMITGPSGTSEFLETLAPEFRAERHYPQPGIS